MTELCKAKIRIVPKFPGESQQRPKGSLYAPCNKPIRHEGAHNSMLEVEGGVLAGPAPKYCAIDWNEITKSQVPGEVIKGRKVTGHE